VHCLFFFDLRPMPNPVRRVFRSLSQSARSRSRPREAPQSFDSGFVSQPAGVSQQQPMYGGGVRRDSATSGSERRVGVAAKSGSRQCTRVLIGCHVPSFEATAFDWDGKRVFDFASDRPTGHFTILCLASRTDWASCQDLLEDLEKMSRKKDSRFSGRFAVICTGDSLATLSDLRKASRVACTLPMIPDPDGRIAAVFGNPRGPQLYLLDRHYTVAEQAAGGLTTALLGELDELQQAEQFQASYDNLMSTYRTMPRPSATSASVPVPLPARATPAAPETRQGRTQHRIY